ncbi:hypothetical protein ACN99C_26770 (plasmid) [Pseudomonas alloputida]|uniref:hypothetical protein n=1 Tax=Pseudomonas alloputida TaxID=1940621 RepID=UPI003B4338AE
MKALIAVAVAAVVLSGCATSSDMNRLQVQTKSMEEQMTAQQMRIERLEQARAKPAKLDQSQFCFNGNMMYSEGAMLGGKTCLRQQGTLVFQNGKPVVQPLAWH